MIGNHGSSRIDCRDFIPDESRNLPQLFSYSVPLSNLGGLLDIVNKPESYGGSFGSHILSRCQLKNYK